jgi:citrate synthase
MTHPGALLDLVSASDASRRLGIRPASLYSYVSRGLVRSFASPHDPRQRLYAAEDVEALVKRRTRFRRPAAAAATALDWGLPVLETHLTQIADGRLFYRGQDAVALAETASFEEVAQLLIGRTLKTKASVPSGPARLDGTPDFLGRAIGFLATMQADASEPAAILDRVAMAAGGMAPNAPLHHHLAKVWNVPEPGQDTIRRALVLFADHELSTSAFAVRVVASTGARLSEAVIAGLAALSGPRHGGATERVRILFEQASRPGGSKRLADAMRLEGSLIGFQHPLYPNGDPRARAILERLPLRAGDARILESLVAAGGQPTIDVALVLLERSYRLPKGAAFALFAVSRTAGWLAHALEQQAQDSLIRPRARYVVEPAT